MNYTEQFRTKVDVYKMYLNGKITWKNCLQIMRRLELEKQ